MAYFIICTCFINQKRVRDEKNCLWRVSTELGSKGLKANRYVGQFSIYFVLSSGHWVD